MNLINDFEQFEKPGRRDDFDYPDMSKESVSKALEDASVSYGDIQQAIVGYVYGESILSLMKIQNQTSFFR